MSTVLLRYKTRFVTSLLLFGYTCLHTKLTGIYTNALFEALVDGSVHLPYAQRLLLPTIVHTLTAWIPLSLDQYFFLFEWLFISLFYFVFIKLLAYEFTLRQAQLLSWLFILLLPLMTVVNYRFMLKGDATFFYPSDTASLFFMAAGFLLCLREQWIGFMLLITMATLNRESSMLLIPMIPALHWNHLKKIRYPLLTATLIYAVTRFLILLHLKNIPGPVMELFIQGSSITHFEQNLFWLFGKQGIFILLFCFAGLPIFWFAFYDYIPQQYRPLKYVVLFYFSGLFLVGHFIEARLFSEIWVLLYLPVCVAISRWIDDKAPYSPPAQNNLLYYFDRYAIITCLILMLLLRQPINALIYQFSM